MFILIGIGTIVAVAFLANREASTVSIPKRHIK